MKAPRPSTRCLAFGLARRGVWLWACAGLLGCDGDDAPPAAPAPPGAAPSAAHSGAAVQPAPADPHVPEPAVDSPVREEFLAIARAIAASDNPYLGTAQVPRARAALAATDLTPDARLQLEAGLAADLLRLGLVDEAAEHIEAALRLTEEQTVPPSTRLLLHQTQGLIYLRQAEVENCIRRHQRDCCILPLEGGGRHAVRAPAERARAALERCLALAPDDLSVRWLLNVLAMALGDYPDGVPAAQLIPPSAFASQDDIGRFPDVAAEAGVDTLNLAGGVAIEDFDGDGLLDIATTTFDPAGPALLFTGLGGLRFADRSAASHLDQQLGGLNCLSADHDGDGDADLLILRGGWLFDTGCIRKSLLENDGHGVFTDVTAEVGLGEALFPSQTACWGDFDDDGRLDLYVGNESRKEQRGDGDFPNQLFRAGDDGRFVDFATAAGVTNDRYTKGVATGDYDNDGDLDLYVSNAGPNRLYRNDGGLRFDDVAEELSVAEPRGRSFACWFFDRDDDGWLDLWVGGYEATIADLAADELGLPQGGRSPCLYANTGGRFRDVAAESGLAHPWLPMGANFGDLDHDGHLDVLLGTGDPGYQTLVPNVALRNDGSGRFLDVTTSAGLGHLQKGHGIGFADFDHDGDQDVFHQIGGFFPGDAYPNALFQNPGHGNHYLYLQLRGTHGHPAAFGARVTVRFLEGGRERQVHRAVGSVSSFGGSPTQRLEIGLGRAERILAVEVAWPSGGTLQTFRDVPLDALLELVEGQAEAVRKPLPVAAPAPR